MAAFRYATFLWNTTDAIGTTFDVHLGAQPKGVMLFGTGSGSAAGVNSVYDSDSFAMMVGAGVSSSNRRCATAMLFGVTSVSASYGTRHTNDAVLCNVGGSSNLHGRLDIDSEANWPTDGIRFIVDEALLSVKVGVGVSVLVIALIGDDVSANIIQFQEPGATGNQSVAHGLSGIPTGVMLFSAGFATAPSAVSATQAGMSFGFFDGTTSAVLFASGDDAATTSLTSAYARTGEVIVMAPDPGTTLSGRAAGSSFDATNVVINWLERALTRYVFGLVWKGGSFKVASTATRTDTTEFDGPAIGFTPSLLFAGTAWRTASTVDVTTIHATWSLGAARDPSDRFAASSLHPSALADLETVGAVRFDALAVRPNIAVTIDALMDLVTMADPPRFVMDDADTSASFVALAAWGDSLHPPLPRRRSTLAGLIQR